VDYPGINLLKKNTIAILEQLGKHNLENWITSDAPALDGIKELATFKTLLLNVFLH
jgi:hypothetical protein